MNKRNCEDAGPQGQFCGTLAAIFRGQVTTLPAQNDVLGFFYLANFYFSFKTHLIEGGLQKVIFIFVRTVLSAVPWLENSK